MSAAHASRFPKKSTSEAKLRKLIINKNLKLMRKYDQSHFDSINVRHRR